MWITRWHPPRGERLTDAVWSLLGLCLFIHLVWWKQLWQFIPTPLLIIGIFAGVYEIYSLANKEKSDTLSEGIWRYLKDRPLVAFGFGWLTGLYFPSGPAIITGIWFLLMGHFIWQRLEISYAELISKYNRSLEDIPQPNPNREAPPPASGELIPPTQAASHRVPNEHGIS